MKLNAGSQKLILFSPPILFPLYTAEAYFVLASTSSNGTSILASGGIALEAVPVRASHRHAFSGIAAVIGDITAKGRNYLWLVPLYAKLSEIGVKAWPDNSRETSEIDRAGLECRRAVACPTQVGDFAKVSRTARDEDCMHRAASAAGLKGSVASVLSRF